ncbi:iron-siderophore ABC transporter substrate-binding protein [Brevibacillus humidisoli]|uniref:ABC transporter substrate-binding protein n=1 Tax=Brevibacillus humidisoli TaxID=2895522 RepID=UPI001E36A8A7|nr:iron-siderophore ABC transporter substrate-binding protein [Brevibacillus humidisoli]UFJ41418.1 iron-siderophore ABC transporter substrate-binding protein [Brevibacillus humidisoli]
MLARTYLQRPTPFRVLALFLTAVLLLAGCGGGQQQTQPSTQPSGDNSASSPGTESGEQGTSSEETRTITHAMGTTEIKGTPQKVVVLVNGLVDISLALGVKPTGAVQSWIGDPWYDYIKDDMQGVTVLGEETQPNLEKIASLKPDLILGSKMRHEKIYTQLSAIAPTVMTETVFDWKENLKLSAEALNKQAEAEKLISDWDKRVADFKQKMGDKLKTEVSLIRFNPDHARIYYTGFPGSIIEEVGLARPESQRVKDQVIAKLTKEQIAQMDGDVIFDFTADWKGDGAVKKLQEEWTNDPLWKNLNAVRNNKVYQVNEVFWNMSGGVMAANKMLDDLYKYFEIEQ